MPYINTIDINGEIYNVGNLTDGTHVVNLPTLTQSGTFLLQEDVINNLTSTNDKAPLSASQGRVLDGKISALKTSASQDDASTLSSAKTYANEKANEALTSANKHTDDSCATINKAIDDLQKTVTDNKASLDNDVKTLTTSIETKSSETLSSANQYTDSSCGTINSTVSALSTTVGNNKSATDTAIANLQKTVQDNKSSADTGVSEVKTYADDTFIAKSKIADNLTTNSSEQVLSAKQGKALGDKKFDKAGGTITGSVTLNGNLVMGTNNIISIEQTPVADNNVVNKKYVTDSLASYEMEDASVTTAKVADSAITKAKLAADVLSYIDESAPVAGYGDWTYMKMRNGYAVAWCPIIKTINLSVGMNDDLVDSKAYPKDLFCALPDCIVDVTADNAPVMKYNIDSGTRTTTPTFKLYYLGEQNSSVALYIRYLAIGKWKS